jgi:predicted DNA-binding protein with PD1-like motif
VLYAQHFRKQRLKKDNTRFESNAAIIKAKKKMASGGVIAHAVRINAGEDLVSSMKKAAMSAMEKSSTSSAFVMTAVGSLECVTLRMSNYTKDDGSSTNDIKEWKQRLEIISLVGTFDPDGFHLHMSVSDKNGNVFGGHLMAGTIFTTLEIVIGVIENVNFSRIHDPATGFKELAVNPK